jgi:ribosomal protein S18 acetylase RimI-like enzyme
MSSIPHISFRQAVESDVDFLRALRAATMREVVLRHQGWCDEEQNQRVIYHFESARIIVSGGREIGLLKVVREVDHVHLVQIQLLPAFQGRGIGTAVIVALQEESGPLGMPIILEAYASNRAVALYSRLGFAIVDRTEHSYTMRWQKSITEPNQALKHNDPSCHASCLRTPRASRGRG